MTATAYQPRARRRSPRALLPLLRGSAAIAIATGASIAHGQVAFQGTPTITAGSVTHVGSNNTDIFTVGSHTAIIDWTPTNNSGTGTIDFLPAGSTGVFQSSTDANFTVLNRINPSNATRPVEFDGHVISQFVNASGAASRAGNVWFYTPGGIIVGATGVFDVGSLILTTNAIDTTNGVPSPGTGIRFRGTAGSTSNITVQPGALINATTPGSYVALVAPRINQGGDIDINGSAALVAAEAADITINAGLFSITNTIGSQVAAGGETTLTHTGLTGGAAATSNDAPHNIYLVAIPKNDAVTMLVSGHLGYQAAANASVVGGSVILSAGYAVDTPTGGPASTISLTNATFTSDAQAFSNGDFTADTGQGNIFIHSLTALADRSVTLHVANGGQFGAVNLTLGSNNAQPIPITISVDSGGALAATSLFADSAGGTTTMTVAGSANLGTMTLASESIASSTNPAPTTGGTASLVVDGGVLVATGAATVIADGNTGGTSEVTVTNSGGAAFTTLELGPDGSAASQSAATGGTAAVTASAGGTITISDSLAVHASAFSSPDTLGASSITGGTASVVADNGTIRVTGTGGASIEANPNAFGNFAPQGTATGGSATLSVRNGGSFSDAGTLLVNANAANGANASAAAQGGTATVSADNGLISVAGATTVTATGDASGVTTPSADAGANAIGGTTLVTVADGGNITANALFLGSGATVGQSGGVAGTATGGTATLQTDTQGTLALGATTIDASALGTTTGTGGAVNIFASNSSGTAPATPIALASLTVTDNGLTSGQTVVQTVVPISIAGDASFTSGSALSLDGLTTGGALSATSTQDLVTLTNITATSVNVTGASVSITNPGALTIGSATATTGDVSINTGGALSFGTMTAANGITVRTTGALTGTSQTSTAGQIDDNATGAIDIGTLSAGYLITVQAGATGHFGTLTAGTNAASNDGTADFGTIAARTGGDLTIDTSATGAGSIGLLSLQGKITGGTLTAGTNGGVGLLATGAIAVGAVTAPGLLYVGGPSVVAGLDTQPTTAGLLTLLASAAPTPNGAAVTIGSAQVGTATIAAGTTLALPGAFTTTGDATLSTGADFTAGNLTSPGSIALTSAGTLTLGDVTAGNATTGGGITLAGTNGVTAGNLTAVDAVTASSSAGAVTLQQVTSSGGLARITATGTITTGDVTAAGSIYLTGGAAITAGNLRAGVGTLRGGISSGNGSGTGGGTDAAPDGVATGFDGTTIEPCDDDCDTTVANLPFSVNYFGTAYTGTYVNNNGYFTFTSPQTVFTPTGLGTGYSGQPIIAAFFADVDTTGTGHVSYGNGTYAGRQAFGATWNAVGYYDAKTDKVNTFQIVLTNRADTGAGNFDIYYNYGNIGWETGEADGGTNGLGGTSAAVGYNAGTGNGAGTFFQLPGSLVPGSFINGGTAPLVTATNDGNPGQFLFSVRNGAVVVPTASEPPTVHVTNIAAGNTADVHLGNISGEAAEVHGAGHVTVGNVTVADQHSGATAPGNPFATVLDASNGLIAGDISGAGFVAIGAAQGDISTGTITSSSSVAVLGDGAISLGAATTGQGAGDTLFVSSPSVASSLTGFSYGTLLGGTTFDPATLATATAAPTGGAVTIGAITAGNVTVASNGAIASGPIGATGAVSLNGGSIGIGGPLSAATLVANSGGSFASNAITTSGDTTITAAGIAIDGTANAANLTATSTGAFTSGGIGATGNVALSGTSIGIDGPLTAATLVANSSGTFASNAITTSGDTSITAAGIAIGGAANAANLTAASSGAFTSGDIGATGNVTLNGTNIAIGGPVTAAGFSATSTGGFTGTTVATTGDTSITGTDVTIAGASAGGALKLVANGALALNGDVDGATIALSSHDIAATGQIGSSRTTSLTFTNSGTGGTYVGAAGAGAADYDLSASELGNAHATAIAIQAPGDVSIGDVALTNANLVGANGGLQINAAGNIGLGGHLAVSGLGAGNTVSLTAGQAITGVLPAAGISLTDANGALAGTLSLKADRIEFDTPATAQAVAAATTLGAQSDALAASDGAEAPGSYIQAGGVQFTVGSALYVQNSGIVSTAQADRAGVTAGAGGISLAGLGTTPVAVVLNARITGANGDVTGQDVVKQIKPGGATAIAYAPQSTVNGCLANGAACGVAGTVETIVRQVQPVQDVVQQIALPSGIGQSTGYSFQSPQLVSLDAVTPPALPPLIDEPVTGAGNDNLWVGVGVGADQPLTPLGGAKAGTATPAK